MIGLTVVVFLVLISIFADVLFDYDTVVIKQNTQIRLQGPSAEHWLGTDEFGRDILARLVHGSRVSLSVGVVAVSISLVLGGSLGAAAGFYGGTIDNVIMRFMDILLAVPSLLLSITIVSALGPSIINLMLAIAISVSYTHLGKFYDLTGSYDLTIGVSGLLLLITLALVWAGGRSLRAEKRA